MARIRNSGSRCVFVGVYFVAFFASIALPTPARTQTIQWTRQFGSADEDGASGVAVDTTGVYVIGTVGVIIGGALPGQTSSGGMDAFVRKYDPMGNVVWTRQFGSRGTDEAIAVAVDATGVYVAGDTNGTLPGQTSSGFTDAFVRKYKPDGNELWTRQFASTRGGVVAEGVAVDATGVYVVGRTSGTLPGQDRAGGNDAFVRKYDGNGTELWTRQFGTSDSDQATGVAVDATGVYVAGATERTIPGQIFARDTEVFVRKYDPSGTEQWIRQFGTLVTDWAEGVTVDATGVYVVGWTSGDLGRDRAGGIDAFVRKYDANGTAQWTRQFGTTTSDRASAVAVYATGVYVAGDINGTLPGQDRAGGSDAFVRKYDASGNAVWTRQFGSASTDWASAVAVDATGVYVVGLTFGTLPGQTSAGRQDAFVVKLAATSAPLPAPVVSDGVVVNNASFALHPAPLAPGSIAAVFGSDLHIGAPMVFSSFGPDGWLVTSLGGTSVRINNIPAPMFYSTPGQLGIQIPFELAGQTSATIQVTVGGQTSVSRTIFLDALAPGIFTLSQDGRGAAAALHEDGFTPVTAPGPARPGEIVVLYATGLGAVTPPLVTGAPSTGNRTSATATVNIDGIPGEVLFSGAAPGFVGLNQINVRIPPSTRSAPNIPVVLSIGGKQSNPVTIPVSP